MIAIFKKKKSFLFINLFIIIPKDIISNFQNMQRFDIYKLDFVCKESIKSNNILFIISL